MDFCNNRRADSTSRRSNAPPNANNPPHDRQRVRRACEICRKKKIKCDGEEPCQRCVNYNVDCEYADYVPPLKSIDASNVEQLEARMASMEEMFRQLVEKLNGKNFNTPDTSLSVTLPQDTAEIISTPTVLNLNCSLNETIPVESASICNEPPGSNPVSVDDDLESHPRIQHSCYADGFGELDADTTGQLRYVGIGSTATVVDTCVGLRRYINGGLGRKGYHIEETFFTSPETCSEATQLPTRESLTRNMPPATLCEVLIDTFIRDIHFLFPIIPKEDIKNICGKVINEQIDDAGAVAVVFATLAVSSLMVVPTHAAFANIDEKYCKPDFGSSMYTLSLDLVNSSFSQSRVDGKRGRLQNNVIALGLLSMYLAATGMQAEAWIMVGRAIRNGQDLGLHRSPERLKLPTEERSRRRYIWWCLYVLERQLCTALGRPLCIDDADCDVEVPCDENDGTHSQECAGFVSLIYLHKIMGRILKTVNSVNNLDAWRDVTKYEELRTRVRDSNKALQIWAKDNVPHEIRSAKSGILLIQKHVALSAFFSAVLLLHRIFMSNPHRPSPLTDPQAHLRCAKAAADCINGASDFLQHVPRSHYLIFHGQYVFVSAIVLLQFVRGSSDSLYNELALRDIQTALKILQDLEGSWSGAKKCRAVVGEYLEFTNHVLQGGRRGVCNFEHSHEHNPAHDLQTVSSTGIVKHHITHADVQQVASERVLKKRKMNFAAYPSFMHPSSTHRNTISSTLHPNMLETGDQGTKILTVGRKLHTKSVPTHSRRPTEIDPRNSHTAEISSLGNMEGTGGSTYFDTIVDNGLGQMSMAESCSHDGFFQDFGFTFNPAELSSLCPDFWSDASQL